MCLDVSGIWALLISAAAVIGVGFVAVWTIVSNITASPFLSVWRPFKLGQTVEVLPENLKARVIVDVHSAARRRGSRIADSQ